MQTKNRILLRKNCLSFSIEDDHVLYILKSGYKGMYIVITDTPYDDPSMQHIFLPKLAELLGVSEEAIEIGLS